MTMLLSSRAFLMTPLLTTSSTSASLLYPLFSRQAVCSFVTAGDRIQACPLVTRTFRYKGRSLKALSIRLSSSLPNSGNCQNVEEIDILAYLDKIELEILRESETEEHQHSANKISKRNSTLIRQISEPNRKPMIRNLINIPSKLDFDEAIRNRRKEVEYEKMALFLQTHKAQLVQHSPHLKEIIDDALSQPSSRGTPAFRRLATGPTYCGNVEDMIQDIIPHAMNSYMKAIQSPTENEILASVIYSQRDKVDEKRIDAAIKCLDFFRRSNNNGDDGGDTKTFTANNNGSSNYGLQQENGKECERLCIAFLENRSNNGGGSNNNFPPTAAEGEKEYENRQKNNKQVLLQNVFVNHKSSSMKQKYQKVPSLATGATTTVQGSNLASNNNNTSKNENNAMTGIIWTNVDRENTSSEFDVVIVDEMMTSATSINGAAAHIRDDHDARVNENTENNYGSYVTEIWEAKYSVSPSTIWDAITRKLSSIQQLMEDDEAILSYNNHNDVAQIKTVLPPSYSLQQQQQQSLSPPSSKMRTTQNGYNSYVNSNNSSNNDGNKMLFGIFGMELLPPSNAVGQLKAMAVADILSKDVNSVMKAIECGYVEVDKDRTIQDLNILREEIQKRSFDFHICINLGIKNNSGDSVKGER